MKATLSRIDYTPRKLRLVANLVKGMKVSEAIEYLQNVNKKGALYVVKTIKSASANALNLEDVAISDLMINKIYVNESLRYKRFRAGSRGRAQNRIRRYSTLVIELK